MKFVVSSTELLGHLQAIGRVISSKNTLPILDNFLFNISGNDLEITASDLESTLITRMHLDNISGSGMIAIPARILLDTLREFSEQPLTFDINTDTMAIVINSENGQFSIVGQNGIDFPVLPVIKQEKRFGFNVSAEVLLAGISRTLFATADDELRPVMGGILVEASTANLTFVASDAHKLVRYQRSDARADDNASFILPKKPASLLKNILPRESGVVSVEFDDRNAFFNLSDYKVVCRLVEGNYPNYNSVIPKNNPRRVRIDRVEFYNILRRVSVFSNQASNLVKLQFTPNQITVSAQDVDFSISAYERHKCLYEGDDMEIGFKSVFLIEILSNIASQDVVIELADPTRAGLFLPSETANEDEDLLMLLMPMMINA
ncbi:MAG TPA: DNA polymerase III subunit beta [Bacteroidales bacterium]|jgi:DNA polymerase-3 subunit beta|nr:DNA polymerase III subunit beta [Bacteroidales bacterium]MDI9533625.1 DNA polymerase III subunit beta [Bacteroidota bacterium]OPZ57126.1 MAG: DNA polymerase III subunit beta [Bacteroidetes bacterium ADurb.BinA012]MBK7733582.1 DNA polymerase III subunit beta [Bacteroidales bacterium]MBP7037200.1 DNA polymerase III subunit beta [Bacteroidales bacterium]